MLMKNDLNYSVQPEDLAVPGVPIKLYYDDQE